MTAEKKARQEIKSMKESEKKEKRKLADGDALKKIKKYEEQMCELKKELAHHKTVGASNLTMYYQVPELWRMF